MQQPFSHHVQYFEDRKEVIVNNRLHSVDDKPAITYNNGDREWYHEGVLHRDGNKPAVIKANMVKYYTHGALEESAKESSSPIQSYTIKFGDIQCGITKSIMYFEDMFMFIFSAHIPSGDHAGNYTFNIPQNWNLLEINSFNCSNTYLVAETNKNAFTNYITEVQIKLHLRAFDKIQALAATKY